MDVRAEIWNNIGALNYRLGNREEAMVSAVGLSDEGEETSGKDRKVGGGLGVRTPFQLARPKETYVTEEFRIGIGTSDGGNAK